MTTAQNVLDVARSQIGYHEVGTNWTKFWQELEPSMQGQPWCAAFASWVFKHAGFPLPAIDRAYGYVSALDGMRYGQSHGLWDTSGHYAPGDLMIFGGGEHTGICESDDGVTLHTIDGNWGDQVTRVVRSHGIYVSGAVKTSRLLTGVSTAPAPTPATPAGTRNLAQTQAIQNAVHVTADGAWGDITSHAATVVIRRDLTNVRYLQARVGAIQDGIWGSLSEAARVGAVKAIQSAIGTSPDGAWGPNSQAAWNVALANNYKKF